MKKLYLFLWICVLPLLGHATASLAESDNKFAVEGTIWNIGISRGPEVYCGSESVAYALLGDMEVNGKLYKKLYAITDTTLINPFGSNHTLIGGYREENGRVWFIPKALDLYEIEFYPEHLAYDFTAQDIDTIERSIYIVAPRVPLNVNTFLEKKDVKTEIKSVTTDDYGKRHLIISDFYTDEWIEGVGSTKGLFWANMTLIVSGGGLRSTELLCMKRNGKIMYLKEGCEKCFSGELDKDLVSIRGFMNEKAEIALSPNPVSEQLNITIADEAVPCVINLYSTTGEYVTGKRLTKAQDQMSMTGVDAGLYVYRIATDGGELLDAGKVIKE